MTGDEKSTAPGLNLKQQQAIESLFADLPETYDERYSALQSLRSAFYRDLAAALEPSLNIYAKAQPVNSQEERSALASSINQMLRRLGLTLVFPRTNGPAILVADTAGRSRKPSFRFQTSETAKKRVRSSPKDEIPDLELMQAPTRIENFARDFKSREKDERYR